MTDQRPLSFGELVRRARRDLDFSQAFVADHLNVSQATVSHWEKGKALPEPAKIRPLCELVALDVNVALAAITDADLAGPVAVG